MRIDSEQLKALMQSPEGERVEFKEAKNSFDSRDLAKYVAALANEGGGYLILGVTNKQPRRVVGSQACGDLNQTKLQLLQRLRIRVEAFELGYDGKRVVVFHAPPRPQGMPVMYDGAAWMRSGESLVPITWDELIRIQQQWSSDFSSEICQLATFSDLDPGAISRFRELWRRKSGNVGIDRLSDEQLLADAELMVEGSVTWAALVLLATDRVLGRHLPQAEIIFEYRSSEASIEFQQRREYREGFLLIVDDLWEQVNIRNEVFQVQDGPFVRSIPTFNEFVVRESILNAVSHRDYRDGGSIFIRQYPRKLEIVSPGGLLPGITTENIIWRQSPRNRRLAESLTRCGLVERSGQGVNRMFELSISEGKRRPDFTGTDEHQVSVTLHGDVQDVRFLRFLEDVARETHSRLDLNDLLVIDLVHREQAIPNDLADRIPGLRDLGVIEVRGRGASARYLLSRRFFGFIGQPGTYTQRKGLDRDAQKALLLQHLAEHADSGCQLKDLSQVLPNLQPRGVQTLMRELKQEGRAHPRGKTRAARWFPGPSFTEGE